MRTQDQLAVRMLVRARMDFQAMRKAMDNRLGRKANGEKQELIDERYFTVEDIDNFNSISQAAREQEKQVEKMLEKTLRRFKVYNEWLSTVKGVGTVMAGWLLGEFDIEKASAVSKMWQYAGLNPSEVRGKKRVKVSEYKEGIGKIVTTINNARGKPEAYIIETEEMVRGDKPTKGFVLPYNKDLKTALMGILAPGFIKSKSSYAIEFYYRYKLRLEESFKEVIHRSKGKSKTMAWKDVSAGHRDMAARRYMVKMFLTDFYVAWRTIEGLDVRKPYAEEYLGHIHKNAA